VALLKYVDSGNVGLAEAASLVDVKKRASQMDPSRGAEKTGTTLPTPRVEPVKLSTSRELEIKFKTNAAGLKLALRSELLSADAANAPRPQSQHLGMTERRLGMAAEQWVNQRLAQYRAKRGRPT
jgi:hypothetical protein